MKRNIFAFSITAILAALLLVLPGCQDTKWDLAEDYDFSAIDPVVRGLTGPAEFAASGLAPARYKVNARTGSTYAWTVTGANVESITTVEGYPGWADVLYSQSGVDVAGVTVSVTETTSGGKTSESVSMTTNLKAFCPKELADFAGTWVGTETGDSNVDPLTVTVRVEGDQLVVEGLGGGIPGFCSAVFEGWGESFQDGFGTVGEVYLDVDLFTGTVSVPFQYWGQTLPGPYDYWQLGDGGTWEACGEFVMSVNFAFNWYEENTVYASSDVVLVKQ